MTGDRPYIHEDFLLDGPTARRLYHEFAASQPIIDYHNHLPPSEIAKDRRFANLEEIWLEGDHYKWRLLRANGVPERLITGDATPREKYDAWARTVPACLGNPLYQWTHMELAKPFGISDWLLNESTADTIWEQTEELLGQPEFSCRGLLKSWGVTHLCTTDDPADDLTAHQKIADDQDFDITVYPTFRPDKALGVDNPETFRAYIERLGTTVDVEIRTYSDLLEALRIRRDAFHALGCRLSDIGMTEPYCELFTASEVGATFAQVLDGKSVDEAAICKFRSAMIFEFGRMAHEKNWTQQYHIGPLRNVCTRLFKSVGPDAGGDAIDDRPIVRELGRMLDLLDAESSLPRTVIYNLNPAVSEATAATMGCFQDGSTPGKIQLGTAWWFNDQEDGIRRQLTVLSNFGLLSQFVGMTTDSRSFLSMSRHDYFRRILCNYLGELVDTGRLPGDVELVGGVVSDICYENVRRYLGFS
jgi:glucuronate isomerase